MIQLCVKLTGCSSPVLDICDSGAEVALMSQRVYKPLSLQPELHPISDKIKGLCGPNYSPLGKCSVKVEIPELAVTIHYYVIVDNIEYFLIHAFMLHYAKVQLKYDNKNCSEKEKL